MMARPRDPRDPATPRPCRPRDGSHLRLAAAAPKVIVLLALAALIAAPLALRPSAPRVTGAARLVIITPHGEATRSEFARAFQAWAARERSLNVEFDWRTPGGTSEIQSYLRGRYRSAFAVRFPTLPSAGILSDSSTKAADLTARAAFLASDCAADDVDLFWGGGEFPHRQFANEGIAVDAGIAALEPDWFRDEVMPQSLSGETVWDAKGRYYGTCFSTFVLIWSPDRLALLADPQPPAAWADLAAPRFLGQLTIADPNRSAAVVSTLERLLQERMAAALATDPTATEAALAQGWAEGFAIIKGIAGNSRWVTDGASKAVRDVVRGDATAGMAIDFHARAEAEWSAQESGGPARLAWAAPAGGTSVSADPICLLRGAPHRTLAVDFIRFVLSPAGQRLWNYRVGAPAGPTRWQLRRLPVRRDVYTDADRALMTDPSEDPFALATSFTYRPGWTVPVRALIGPLVKAVCLDPRAELELAWRAILKAGGPAAVPAAWAEFIWMPAPYGELPTLTSKLKDAATSLPLLRGWTTEATRHYRLATELAQEGR